MTTGTYHYVTLSVPFEEISLDKYNIINSGYLCEVFIASQEIIVKNYRDDDRYYRDDKEWRYRLAGDRSKASVASPLMHHGPQIILLSSQQGCNMSDDYS